MYNNNNIPNDTMKLKVIINVLLPTVAAQWRTLVEQMSKRGQHIHTANMEIVENN